MTVTAQNMLRDVEIMCFHGFWSFDAYNRPRNEILSEGVKTEEISKIVYSCSFA